MDRRRFICLAGGILALPAPALASAPGDVRRLDLVNAHTGERFAGPYRDNAGPIASALDELSDLLRDHRSGRKIAVDVGVLDFLAAILDAVGATRATVLSAYRTVETNAMLARTAFGAADNSQHLYGRALDFHLGARLADAMQAARAMQRGGVGWYPNSGFVHIDSGPVRNWTLEGNGFEKLVMRVRDLLARKSLTVSPQGGFVAGRHGRALTANERLALHRIISKAEALVRQP